MARQHRNNEAQSLRSLCAARAIESLGFTHPTVSTKWSYQDPNARRSTPG